MILPADKGHCTVLMDETEYHAKVNSLLANQMFYKVFDKDARNVAWLGLKKNGTIPELRLKSGEVGHA